MKKPLVRDYDKFLLRLPDGVRDDIAAAAKNNDRSMNEEILTRLSAGHGVLMICDDTREIDAIWLEEGCDGPNGWCTTASEKSSYKCDRIRAYAENGQCAPVPFFAVIKGDQIVARVPAHMVEVRYK